MKNYDFAKLALPLLLSLFLLFTTVTVFAGDEAPESTGQPYDYSQFLTDLDAGNVKKVVIKGKNIKVFLKNGQQRSTYSPGDPGLIGDLIKHEVDIAAQPPGIRSDDLGHDAYRRPNPAGDILCLSEILGLSAQQKTELRELRDEWTKNQTVPQAEYIVARSDLVNMLYSEADPKSIDEQLEKVAKLERRAWQAFIVQYQHIVKLLNDAQREVVREGEIY